MVEVKEIKVDLMKEDYMVKVEKQLEQETKQVKSVMSY